MALNHLRGVRVGEAQHPGPSNPFDEDGDVFNHEDSESTVLQAFGAPPDGGDDAFLDHWDAVLTSNSSVTTQQPQADSSAVSTRNAPEPQAVDNHSSPPTDATNGDGDDPLPGHPAGRHNSAARSRSLRTWDIINQWVKFPTKAGRQSERPKANPPATLITQEFVDAAAANTPCIPFKQFLGELPGYVFSLRGGRLGYHANNSPAPPPKEEAPQLPVATTSAATIYLSDVLTPDSSSDAHTRRQQK